MNRIPATARLLSAAFSLLLFGNVAQAASLSLQECLEQASTYNGAIRLAAHERRVAAQAIPLSRSGELPRIDILTGYTAQLEPQAVKIGPSLQTTQEADFGFLSLSLQHSLYDFGRTRARVEQAVLHKDATNLRSRSVTQDVFLQVIQTYYGILQNRHLLQAAEDELKQREQHLSVARTLHENGVVTRNDVLQAEVRHAASRQKHLTLSNLLSNGWLRLNHLTGNPADFRADLDEELDKSLPAALPNSHDTFLSRPELAAQRKQIALSEAAVTEAHTGFYPEFYLKLGLDYIQNSKVAEQAIMYATVGLRVNLFDGHATNSRERQATAILSREQEKLRDLEKTLELELATAKNDELIATERISVAKTTIRQAEENLRITSDRYQAQVGTATEVLDAQTLLAQTRADHFRAIYDARIAKARIKRALGQL